ncbi:lipoyl(octanoyl) transferase [Desulfocicer vacuolatum DSM 3385]|uniref:Octanoyltransferase n=1 Tax=Desulfocicer vacuolatum DSM 3385 TaxID=1121400 RepID=A0A1W1Z792_9BACT|nr:lipoyl(octanoyl) transferase LipB [Desulfocicer vacuolatum]SMC44310.1 lipoyl(octanoyl) transferase [Desulfocicer vacuolatum DSM 3385]
MPFELMDLGLVDYEKALDLQQQYVTQKKNKALETDMILMLEHPAVFTLGKRGGRENLMVSEDFLKEQKVPVVQTGRGGNITFHGPGQLVVYPIMDLDRAGMGVADFVHLLEEIMIQMAGDVGVTARRSSANHGIWVENRKLGSIGLSITRGISFHGLALNANVDLTPFSWVNPCGLSGVSMTSLENELQQKSPKGSISMPVVKESFVRHFTRAIKST